MFNRKFVLAIAMVVAMGAMALPASATTFGLADGLPYPTAFGEYVGPYNGLLNGAPVPAICLDINRSSSPNTTWAAVASLPSDTAEKEAAYLAKRLFSISPDSTGAVQMAIWYLIEFDVNGNHNTSIARMGGSLVASVKTWLDAAVGTENTASNYAGVTIYSPTDTNNQRFMVYTPEPTTLVLYGLGLGMLLMGNAFRKRHVV